jgi:hypothetical protein
MPGWVREGINPSPTRTLDPRAIFFGYFCIIEIEKRR